MVNFFTGREIKLIQYFILWLINCFHKIFGAVLSDTVGVISNSENCLIVNAVLKDFKKIFERLC